MRYFRLVAGGVAALTMIACKGAEKEETAKSVAGDSALQADLEAARADTAAFSEAADVAMANSPQGDAPLRESAPVSNRVPSTRPSGSGVGMRTNPTAAPPTNASPAAPQTRPALPPATAESFPGPSCASAAVADQRRCLLDHLARSDVGLDRNYQAVITALKAGAGTGPGDKEPPEVTRLRVAQRAWLVYRDTECRRRNRGKEGPLWAPMRAECLAEFSGQRTSELAAELAKLRAR